MNGTLQGAGDKHCMTIHAYLVLPEEDRRSEKSIVAYVEKALGRAGDVVEGLTFEVELEPSK